MFSKTVQAATVEQLQEGEEVVWNILFSDCPHQLALNRKELQFLLSLLDKAEDAQR